MVYLPHAAMYRYPWDHRCCWLTGHVRTGIPGTEWVYAVYPCIESNDRICTVLQPRNPAFPCFPMCYLTINQGIVSFPSPARNIHQHDQLPQYIMVRRSTRGC